MNRRRLLQLASSTLLLKLVPGSASAMIVRSKYDVATSAVVQQLLPVKASHRELIYFLQRAFPETTTVVGFLAMQANNHVLTQGRCVEFFDPKVNTKNDNVESFKMLLNSPSNERLADASIDDFVRNFDEQSKLDFRQRRISVVDGWVVSRTEKQMIHLMLNVVGT